jgi:hypothetical protein
MSRYKGKQQAKTIERDFPHVVEIAVPPDGLGSLLIAMYEFHARHGIEARAVMGAENTAAISFAGALPIQESLKRLKASLAKSSVSWSVGRHDRLVCLDTSPLVQETKTAGALQLLPP